MKIYVMYKRPTISYNDISHTKYRAKSRANNFCEAHVTEALDK